MRPAVLATTLAFCLVALAAQAQGVWPRLEQDIKGVLGDRGIRPARLASALPAELRDSAWAIGVESGLAEHCGLDWRTTRLAPMMAIAQQSGRFDDVGLKALATWHDVAQRKALRMVAGYGACTPELQSWLAARGMTTKAAEPITGAPTAQ